MQLVAPAGLLLRAATLLKHLNLAKQFLSLFTIEFAD